MDGSLGVRKGAWTREEDVLLRECIEKYGEGKWHQIPSRSGLNRCRKSCRLRWLNYLRPDINRGEFATDEVDLIIRLHKLLGNRWSLIAGRLPGRTSNGVKNYWNTHLSKKYSNSFQKRYVKDVADKTNKVAVIKPCPRTFVKNLSYLKGKASKEDDVPPAENTLTMPPLSDDEFSWLESLFTDEEEGHPESTTLGDGTGKQSIPSSWEEEMPAAMEVGETQIHENESYWSHLSMEVGEPKIHESESYWSHMDLWDLLKE